MFLIFAINSVVMDMKNISFAKTDQAEFYKELRKRVNGYFKENNISRYANFNMVFKTIFMISLYFVPYLLMLNYFESTIMLMLMWAIMGFGMAGIGLSIMHDANHGAYSKVKWINTLMGNLIHLVGGSDINWRIQHNVLHHTYTNVAGMDEDIDAGSLLRFSPHQKMLKGHKYQYLYAWFLYGMMTVMWATSKDIKQHTRYRKRGLNKTQGLSDGKALFSIIANKVVYYTLFLVLPLIYSDMSWWGILLCFFMMHFIAGLTLALIFQPAHVIPTSDFPVPDKSGNIEADWAVNQLMNTANFANKSRLFSWYVGGLNYQIEHHLFPNICHIHYRKISKIVSQTAKEYKLPYHTYNTFMGAVKGHATVLYNLGRYKNVAGSH